MISSFAPGFLLAGLALSTAALLLHFLARTPPERQALPTARFLREDARTLLRLRRRPTDPLLLCVRMAFALLLGAALSGLTWTPDRRGTGRVVLLDAGADALADWDSALSLARQAMDGSGDMEGSVIAYGLDGGVRTLSQRDLSELQRGSRPASLEEGLRALRGAVLSQTSLDTAEVMWVTRPSWGSWNTGVGLLRPALWPGRITMVPVPHIAGSAPLDSAYVFGDASVRTAQIRGPGEQTPIVRALEALGLRVMQGDDVESGINVRVSDSLPDWIYADSPSAADLSVLLDRGRTGATVVLSGALPGPDTALPWVSGAAGAAPRGGIVLSERAHLAPLGALVAPQGGAPAQGARVVAVFEDGTAAAVARPTGAGCLVYLAASIHDPALTGSVEFPTLVDDLGRGCGGWAGAEGALDRGALRVLEGADLAERVDVAGIGISEGYSLTRWLALMALLLFAAEIGLTRRRRG